MALVGPTAEINLSYWPLPVACNVCKQQKEGAESLWIDAPMVWLVREGSKLMTPHGWSDTGVYASSITYIGTTTDMRMTYRE